MVKKKGMKSCGDEWKTVYNPNKRKEYKLFESIKDNLLCSV